MMALLPHGAVKSSGKPERPERPLRHPCRSPWLPRALSEPDATQGPLRAPPTMICSKAKRGRPMDVMVWLRSLGLGKYEAAFRENEIDETVLPNLTAEDLKELGVAALGHRRKLLDAIAALRGDTTPKVVPTAQASAAPQTSAPATEATGERRYLTVVFCDLVGSTSISAPARCGGVARPG